MRACGGYFIWIIQSNFQNDCGHPATIKEGAPFREAFYDCLDECEEKLLNLGEEQSEDPGSVIELAYTVFEILARAAKDNHDKNM